MPVDLEIIRRLINHIENNLRAMQDPGVVKEKVNNDEVLRLSLERRLQTSIEACIDIAFHIVATKNLGSVEHNKDAILLLGQKNIIKPDLAGRLASATDMRNVLVHGYGRIDFDMFYKAITEDVVDLEDYLRQIGLYLGL